MTALQQVSESELKAFRARFAGRVLTSSDGMVYDTARAVFNGMSDRRPRDRSRYVGHRRGGCTRLCPSGGLPIAVRGGGHSVAGYSTIDDGLVIDLGPMSGIDVDPGTHRARVGQV